MNTTTIQRTVKLIFETSNNVVLLQSFGSEQCSMEGNAHVQVRVLTDSLSKQISAPSLPDLVVLCLLVLVHGPVVYLSQPGSIIAPHSFMTKECPKGYRLRPTRSFVCAGHTGEERVFADDKLSDISQALWGKGGKN